MSFVFSPRPIGDYVVTDLATCAARQIADLDQMRAEAAWNLYWLSNPELDRVSEASWWSQINAVPGGLVSVIDDISEDEVLFRKVRMHPSAFIQWFEREDHTIFDSYTVYGGKRWVATVLARAAQAAERVEALRAKAEGNVIKLRA